MSEPHLLDDMRRARPLVQVITNYVSMDLAANALLALGAAPAMIHAPEEAAQFAVIADALVVNIGTISETFFKGMRAAAAAAHAAGKPWVLDPVGAGATRYRDEVVAALLEARPSIIRGNGSEILAVARVAGLSAEAAAPKGVDSLHEAGAAKYAAVALARRLDCVVAVTGAVDLVTDGARVTRIANGAEVMTRVTACGCALSAAVGAFAAATPDRFAAAVAALEAYAIAGEIAAETSAGPGSFRVAFLDILSRLENSDIAARSKTFAEAAFG